MWAAVLLLALAVATQGHVPSSHLIDTAAGDYVLPTAGLTVVSQGGLTATLASLLALPRRMAAATAREVCNCRTRCFVVVDCYLSFPILQLLFFICSVAGLLLQ